MPFIIYNTITRERMRVVDHEPDRATLPAGADYVASEAITEAQDWDPATLRMLPPWALHPRRVSVLAFYNRFTPESQALVEAKTQAANALGYALRAIKSRLDNAPHVELDGANAAKGRAKMAEAGVPAAELDAIFGPDCRPGEEPGA